MYSFALATEGGSYTDSSQTPYINIALVNTKSSSDELTDCWYKKFENAIRSLSYGLGRTTNGNDRNAQLFSPVLPSNELVIDSAVSFIQALPISNQKRIALLLLEKIHHAIFSNDSFRENVPFAQIAATKMDDGTLLLEWAYKYGRVNFFIDDKADESCAIFLMESLDTKIPVVYEFHINEFSIDSLAGKATAFVSRFA